MSRNFVYFFSTLSSNSSVVYSGEFGVYSIIIDGYDPLLSLEKKAPIDSFSIFKGLGVYFVPSYLLVHLEFISA